MASSENAAATNLTSWNIPNARRSGPNTGGRSFVLASSVGGTLAPTSGRSQPSSVSRYDAQSPLGRHCPCPLHSVDGTSSQNPWGSLEVVQKLGVCGSRPTRHLPPEYSGRKSWSLPHSPAPFGHGCVGPHGALLFVQIESQVSPR